MTDPFPVSLLTQVVRWLHIKREYGVAQTAHDRNKKLAFTGAAIGMFENIPQVIITFLFLSLRTDNGLPSWTPGAQINVAFSIVAACWKLLVPALIHSHLL